VNNTQAYHGTKLFTAGKISIVKATDVNSVNTFFLRRKIS